MRRSRTHSSSADSLLSYSHTTARLALQREVLPGAVKSGSLESLLQGMYQYNVIFSGVLNLSRLVNKEWTMYCCEQ